MVRDAVIERDDSDALHDEIRQLRRELSEARREVARARDESNRAMSALRKQLNPLYRALQAVFGELDAAHVDDAAPATNARTSAVWESWKARLPGRPAQAIDALLLHGPMNSTQIGIAIGMHRNNVPVVMHKLNKAGLIDKQGNKYALKTLSER